MPGRVFCARCAADLSALPARARYCNRCGSPLPEPARSTHAAGFASVAVPPSLPPEPFQPPLILLAYGRALFNLGYRYETAVGSRRNLLEAGRCYSKAARLGDAAALARYGAEATDRPLLPYLPPPLPAGAAAFGEPTPPFATVHRPGNS